MNNKPANLYVTGHCVGGKLYRDAGGPGRCIYVYNEILFAAYSKYPSINFCRFTMTIDVVAAKALAIRPSESGRFLERAKTGEQYFPQIDTGMGVLS